MTETPVRAPTQRCPAPARRPVREALKRWLLARCMALEAIGDIADVGFTDAFTGPDKNIYFHDDFGDGKFQNRDGDDTTTYNGVTGRWRPEWTVDQGTFSVNASNELVVAGTNGETIRASMDLAFNETITWEFDFGKYNNPGSESEYNWVLYADSTDFKTGFDSTYFPGYRMHYKGDGTIRLEYYDSTGNQDTRFINTNGPSSPSTVKVERSASGDWTVWADGNQQGTGSESTLESVQVFGIAVRDGQDHDATLNEIKVF